MKVDKTKSADLGESSEPRCSKSLSDLRNKVDGASCYISRNSSSKSLSSRSFSQIKGADDLSTLFDK